MFAFLSSFMLLGSASAMATDPVKNDNRFAERTSTKVAQEWDVERYQAQHSFVWQLGSSLIDLLEPNPGELILDVGCGTGELTNAVHQSGACVVGIDTDPRMIAQAQSRYPHIEFKVADARSFTLPTTPVDAIFSNAALHWVPEAERAVECMTRALKPQGRFVAEFGGKGNIGRIAAYLDRAVGEDRNPWYFPSIAEYSSLLEKHGLEVTLAQLYDRPTPLDDGDEGLRNWILMFGGFYLEGLNDEDREKVLAGADLELRSELYVDGQWTADYRRIRLVAVKRY